MTLRVDACSGEHGPMNAARLEKFLASLAAAVPDEATRLALLDELHCAIPPVHAARRHRERAAA